MTIRLAESEQDLRRCFPVIAELRPHLSEQDFLDQARRQMDDGYRLAYVEYAGAVAAVAGFRFSESLAWGRYLYVDDLVTHSEQRSQGHGNALMQWLTAQAREQGCRQLHLDSGVQRFGAHKFYLREGMFISSHHFTLLLDEITR